MKTTKPKIVLSDKHDELSREILLQAFEIKKVKPELEFGLILKDLIGGIKDRFQIEN